MKKYSRAVGIGIFALAAVTLTACSSKSASTTTTTTTAAASTTAPKAATTSAPPTTTASAGRKVQGTATTLGAGTFTGGKDVSVGLYDVTTAAGQSGNFSVTGTDSYNEILGNDGSGDGVPSVRVQISSGDQIQIQGLSTVVFTPVTGPYVTAHATTNLGAGTWVVGKDIGPGRYVATPGAGQSGNFTIGTTTNEILGTDTSSGDVPSVAVTLNNGDVIQISGMSQVTMTAQ